jgi:hypothetical protein
MRYRKKQEPEIYNFYEQTFNDAALALFKNSQRVKKDVGGGTELLYMKVPFSNNMWVTEDGLRGAIVEVAIKLHARCWFDLYKPPGAPQLPLDPFEIEAYIETNDPLWQRTGYFARALAKTDYRIHSNSARNAVRNLTTLPMADLRDLFIMV